MPKKIPLEAVKKDNSNLYQYDKTLSQALWNCQGAKNRYKPGYGSERLVELVAFYMLQDMHITYPYDDVDFRLDFQKFIEVYHEEDQQIFSRWLEGYNQPEIGRMLKISQSKVSYRLAFMVEEFKEYYKDE